MAKQLNVNMSFTADTAQAKQKMQELQSSLRSLMTNTKFDIGVEEEIRDAISATAELSAHLKQATNIKTGNLDFSKLNQSIKGSGKSLQEYGRQLQSLGPQGQQAFMQLTNAIAQAEIPMRRTNALVKEFATTLANTARWQLSSTVLHGFMGALQSAYGYAQDLNESLNNIRIVTGLNTDEMARFAKEANEAARALSTTTTAYTNASLIYYQQGLSADEVKKRADVTIKLANVSRQSAEVVSDQLTSVWNNFYDGSKSLEHYADVMTALGAATASSTEEIAGGLEKFAAVANTIGLSYEYAASALATITSNTRESEEVVGTALKTIFARIQGLTLGETLEDGTTLNKYSEALYKVGINIKDASGGLKDMDTILDELGAKWQQLSKDQQIALAQTVAGTRQYNQLIALMANWNNGDSDSFMSNLSTAQGSSGALTEQADIYGESWEAASDRVKAAFEGIYDQLLSDDFFIKFLNNIEQLLDFVNKLIDKIGGLKGVLAAAGTIMTKVFSEQLSKGLNDTIYNLSMRSEKYRQSVQDERNAYIKDVSQQMADNIDNDSSTVNQTAAKFYQEQLTCQQQMVEQAEKMSEIEKITTQNLLDQLRIRGELAIKTAQEVEKAKEKQSDAFSNLYGASMNNNGSEFNSEKTIQQITILRETAKATANVEEIVKRIQSKGRMTLDDVKELNSQVSNIEAVDIITEEDVEQLQTFISDLSSIENLSEEDLGSLIGRFKSIETSARDSAQGVLKAETKELKNYQETVKNTERASKQLASAKKEVTASSKTTSDAIANASGTQKTWGDLLVNSANVAFNAATAFSMVGSALDTIKNPELGSWEKFVSVMGTLGILLPTLIGLWKGLKTIINVDTVAKIANIAATIAQAAAEKKYSKARGDSTNTMKKGTKQTWKDTAEKIKNSWNQSALKKNSNYTKTKSGSYAVKGRKGFVSGGDAAKMAGKEALGTLGGVAASIGLIAAGIAIIAGGIAWGVNQAKKAEKAVEKAKERVKELQGVLDTVKSTYDDFMSKTQAYESAKSGIDSLTKGTKEYQEAVFKANQAAMDLLATHKNLKYEVKDGLIVFDETSLANAERAQKDALARTQASKYAADQSLIAAETNLQQRDMSRDLTSKADFGQQAGNVLGAAGTGLLGGAAIGAGIGTAIGGWAMGIGTVVGTIIGAVAGLISGVVTGLTANGMVGSAVSPEYDALNKIAVAYENDSSALAKTNEELTDYLSKSIDEGGLGIQDDKLIASLVENRDEVAELAEEMRKNTAMINAQNDLIAAQLLGDNGIVAGSEFSDDIIDKAGDVYGVALQEALNSKSVQDFGVANISQATGVNDAAKNVFDEYLKYAGLESKGYQLVDTTGNDKNRKFVYLDENGERKEVTAQAMQYAKATYIAAGKMEAAALQLAATFSEWSKKEDASSQAMLSFLTGSNFEEATQSEFESIEKDIEAAGGTKKYLTAQLGDLTEAAKKYGYASADELVIAFNAALKNGSSMWDDIDLPQTLNDAVGKNITISTTQQIENLIDIIDAGPLGEQAGIEFANGLATMLKNVDAKDYDEALSKIMAIDWTQYDAGEQIKDILKEMGYEINMTEEQFAQWVSTMNTANYAFLDYKNFLETLRKIDKISSTIDVGDIISADDYQLLVDFNDELANYFRILGTGEAKLIGDVLDFQQDIDDTEKAALQKTLTETQSAYNIALERQKTSENAKAHGGREALASSAYQKTGTKTVTVKNEADGWDVFLGHLSGLGKALSGEMVRISDEVDAWAGYSEQTVDEFGVVQDAYQNQLDFLAQEGVDISKFTAAGAAGESDAQAVAKAVEEVLARKPELASGELEQKLNDILEAQIEWALTANSAEERKAMYERGEISSEAFGAAALQAHNEEKWEGLDSAAAGDYAKHLKNIADSSDILADTMGEEAAEDVAAYTMKMNRGIETLNSNLEEWSSILTASDKSSQEYCDSMKNIKKAMSDVLGVSEEFLSDDFIIENMENIQKAAEGDADAINALAVAAGKDILVNIKLADESIRDELLNLHESLATEIPDIEVGATLNSGDFLTKAAQIVEAAGMSVEEANAYFRSLGFEPNFKTETVTMKQATKNIKTTTKVTKWGGGIFGRYPAEMEQSSVEVPGPDVETTMEVPMLTTDGGEPNFTLTRTNSGGMANASGGNTGSSGATPASEFETTKKLDIVDRYKEVNDALAETSEAADRASKAMDRLYGSQRASQMATVGELMKEEIDLLNDKKKEIEGNLTVDQTAVNNALTAAYSAAGMTGNDFSYDANGNISNYTTVMESLFNNLSSAETAAMADGMITEAEQKHIDNLKKMIEELKTAIAQYDDTNSELTDVESQLTDKFYEWQDNNQEILTYKLELNLEVNELELQQIEYYLNKLGNDFYAMAEAAQYLIGTAAGTTLNTSGSKLATTLSNASNYQTLYDDTVTGYNTYVKTNENGELVGATQAEYEAGLAQRSISDAAYVENLKTVYNGLIENLSALNELDNTMMAYYGETVTAAVEEIDVYTERMAHHTTVLEHYNKLLGIIGEENNYKAIGVVLEGQAKTAENSLKVSTKMYETFADEAEHWQTKMAEALAEGDTAAFELYQDNWAAAEAQARESQDKMLSDLAAWAEAEKAVLENTLSDLGKTLEESLTGGLSFDKLSTQMERAQSLQEEYLTTTNQIYETTKMMRTAQQAIDASSNTVAKEKLKNFITETKSLQEQGKLSQYELDMQQAKYDLLVAEIALEEAQNAKSTVRLQRDSEGNFGYVYTADASAVSEAQQQFDDAENALYNKGLDGANNYAQKYNTTMQEMYDTFNQIQQDRLNGAFTTEEEYHNAMAEAKAYYYQKLQDYSNLYGVAVSADSNIAAEAWSTNFTSMINATDQWKQDVDTYMLGANEAFTNWAETVATVKETTGGDITALSSNVKTLTDEHNTLTDAITNEEDGLLVTIQSELDAIGNLTTAYATYRAELQETITTLEAYAVAAKNAIAAESSKTTPDNPTNNNNPPPNSPSTPTPTTISRGGSGGGGGNFVSLARGSNLSNMVLTMAATGGMTTNWGPEGKMLMVHENELILNSDQTNRFFENLALMESILATIDSYALSQQLGGTLSSPGYVENGNDVLEQNVKIEASFPGVTDRTEIEEAFNNLVNKASQYANRK